MSDAPEAWTDRRPDPRHLLAAALVWVLGLPLLGLAAVVLRLMRAHDAVGALPPDQRASYLASAIESAMNATAVTSVSAPSASRR